MNEGTKAPPLIITVKMDPASQDFFDKMRHAHFPSHINYLKAHITLFHKLPSAEGIVSDTVLQHAKTTSFTVEVSGLKHIGNGVVYMLESTKLTDMHRQLQHSFKPFLCRQDAQHLWPHITIQNKVTNYKSQQLYNQLTARFKPFTIKAVGLQAWVYLNGPWKLTEEFLFGSE